MNESGAKSRTKGLARIIVATKAVKSAPAAGKSRSARSSEPATPEGRARRYDPAETRARVLDAAYQLFSARGYANTGTADIAREANVSEGSIFYHFGSKQALLQQLGRMHGAKMIAAMEGDEGIENLTLAETINRCFSFAEANHMWEAVSDNPDCKPHAKSHHSPEAEPFFEAAREVVQAWTRAHLDAVAARYGGHEIDTEIAASLIFALVSDGMKRYFEPGATLDEQMRIRAEVVRFCTAAAGHPAHAGPLV